MAKENFDRSKSHVNIGTIGHIDYDNKAYSKVFNRAITKKIEEKPYIVDLKDKVMLQKFEEIMDYIISECKKMDINPEIVQNKLDLSSYISNSEKLENIFEKWKIELFGKRIMEIKER